MFLAIKAQLFHRETNVRLLACGVHPMVQVVVTCLLLLDIICKVTHLSDGPGGPTGYAIRSIHKINTYFVLVLLVKPVESCSARKGKPDQQPPP